MTATHRIDELLFDLAFESPAIDIARAEQLRSLVVDKLLPLMEQVFDQFGDDGEVWQIDQLVVDIGDVTEAELPTALVAALRTALDTALHDKLDVDGDSADARRSALSDGASGSRRLTRRRADSELLLAFLADGTLSWQMGKMDVGAPASHQALLARVLEQGDAASAFVQALAAAPQRAVMLARLARQFATAQLQSLLRAIQAERAEAVLSALTDLQQLLQDAALARTAWSGAMHAAWEVALALSLDRKEPAAHSGRSSWSTTLLASALNWLAGQQHQDVAAVAAQLLSAASQPEQASASRNELVQALRQLAAGDGGAGQLTEQNADDTVPQSAAATGDGGRAATIASAATATSLTAGSEPVALLTGGDTEDADELTQAWQTLARRPEDRALLRRLLQDSAPALLQAMLRRFYPVHAGTLLAQLDALQRVLEQLALPSARAQAALSAAWEQAFSTSLTQPTREPRLAPLLEATVTVLAAELTTTDAAVPLRTQALRQLHAAAMAAGDPVGLASALLVMQVMPPASAQSPDPLPVSSIAPSTAAAPTIATSAQQDVAQPLVFDTSEQAHASPAAVAPIRNRVTSALMGGSAGDLYEDWRVLRDSQPDLLRSALLHYGGYAEIREKIASTFPLSLLLDMQTLLAPAAARLSTQAWADEALRTRAGAQSAEQWSHWRRNWWRGAFAYLLQAARMPQGSAAFNLQAYVAAALAGAGVSAADQEFSEFVMALAQERAGLQGQESNQAVRQEPRQESTQEPRQASGAEASTATRPQAGREQVADSMRGMAAASSSASTQASSPPSLSSLFESIRRGAWPLQTQAFELAQLQAWVSEAVREPSFHQAIADHAVQARDQRAYYVQVLQALAENRIVDLEEFIDAEEGAQRDEAPELHQTLDLSTVDVATSGDAARNEAAQAPAANTTSSVANPDMHGTHDMRDKAQLVARLAKALMKGDPALLYGDWDVLLHKHAPLLEEAVRHYGIRADILARIVASFPESMLYDLAVLLAPTATSAWQQLRDADGWAAIADAAIEPEQAPPAPAELTAHEQKIEQKIAQEADKKTQQEAQQNTPQEDRQLTLTPDMLAAWKRQLWKAALTYVLRGARQDEQATEAIAATTDIAADGIASAPMPDTGVLTVSVLMAALASDAELAGLPWQHRMLVRWTGLSSLTDEARPDHRQDAVVGTGAQAEADANAVMNNAQDHKAGANVVHVAEAAHANNADDISFILHHRHALNTSGKTAPAASSSRTPASTPATENLPELPPDTVRAELVQRFARLRDDPTMIASSLTIADLQALIEAHILAHGAGGGAAAHAQQQVFLQAIKTQAPAITPLDLDRRRYFKAVLQALLQEQMLDLEEIAELSTMDPSPEVADQQHQTAVDNQAPSASLPTEAMTVAADTDEETDKETDENTEQSDFADQRYIDALLAADFRNGAALPAGLTQWLTTRLRQATSDNSVASAVAAMLAQLTRHPEAVTRLLDLLPASSWQSLTTLAPHSAQQVQSMRRYAGDVADMFAEQNRQLLVSDLVRLERRFLLPYLFAADRIFEPARFTGELISFLARESGLAAPPGLIARVRSQMGIAVTTPRTPARAMTPAHAGQPASQPATARDADHTLNQNLMNTADNTVLPGASAIHVANAGMVLTWPFLSRAWDMLGLTQEGKFINAAAAQRAAWLLQFAVDEQTDVPEYQLTLNKLLSGIPLQAPIVPEIEVTEEERAMIEQVLMAMIGHWKSLGNTSLAGLRETFLQREGQLSRKEDAWHLQVPRKTFDVLLEALPWSIATIRLPWMDGILWVEWV